MADTIDFTEIDTSSTEVYPEIFRELQRTVDMKAWIALGIPSALRDSLIEIEYQDGATLRHGTDLINGRQNYPTTGYTNKEASSICYQLKDFTISSVSGANIFCNVGTYNLSNFTLGGSQSGDDYKTVMQRGDRCEIMTGLIAGRLYIVEGVNSASNYFNWLGFTNAAGFLRAGDTFRLYRPVHHIPWSRLETSPKVAPNLYQNNNGIKLQYDIDDTETLIPVDDDTDVRKGDIYRIDREWFRVNGFNYELVDLTLGVITRLDCTRHINDPVTGKTTVAKSHGAGNVLDFTIGKCWYDYDATKEGWSDVCLKQKADFVTAGTTKAAQYTHTDNHSCTNTLCPFYRHEQSDYLRYGRILHEIVNRPWIVKKQLTDGYTWDGGLPDAAYHFVGAEGDFNVIELFGPSLAALFGDDMMGISYLIAKGVTSVAESLSDIPNEVYFPHSGVYLQRINDSLYVTGMYLQKFVVSGITYIEDGIVFDLFHSNDNRAYLDATNDPNRKSGADAVLGITFTVGGELLNYSPVHGEASLKAWDGDWEETQ